MASSNHPQRSVEELHTFQRGMGKLSLFKSCLWSVSDYVENLVQPSELHATPRRVAPCISLVGSSVASLMELSPYLYHRIVRPRWGTKRYIHDVINVHFQLRDKLVLDFGAGVGSNCSLVAPENYIGLERCPKRVQFASRLYPEYQFRCFTGDKLPAPSSYFDFIMVVAVLHHIPSTELCQYMTEFHRILKRKGQLLILEPCLTERSIATDWFMKSFDKGQYVRNEQQYLEMFQTHQFSTHVLHRFKKLFLYNELFFTATSEY